MPRFIPRYFGMWKATHAYGNVYRLEYTSADNCITLASATVGATVTLSLDGGVRLVKIEINHMDASHDNLETYPWFLKITREAGDIEKVQYHKTVLVNECFNEGFIQIFFGETFEYEPSKFTIQAIDGDTAYKISPIFYVQMENF